MRKKGSPSRCADLTDRQTAFDFGMAVAPSAPAAISRRGLLAIASLFLAFFSAGLFVLWQCPPVWRGYDGFIQINFPPDDFTILQYPAAYPLFSRLHLYATQIAEGRRAHGKHHKAGIDIRKPVPFDDTAISVLLTSQEFLLAVALTGFVVSVARSALARAFAALLLISDATFFLSADMIGGEALSAILLVSLAALGFQIFRADRLSGGMIAGFAALFYAAILTRHEDATFAGLLPLAFLFSGLLARRGGANGPGVGAWRATAWKRGALLAGVGVFCLAMSALTTRILCRVFDVPYRSTSPRRTSERLGFVDQMTADEKSSYLAGLQSRTNDPIVRELIPRLARNAGWADQRAEIESVLLAHSPGWEPEALHVEADRYLELVSSLFFVTLNRHLVAGTVQGIWKGLISVSPASVSRFYLWAAAGTIDIFAATPYMARTARGLVCCAAEAKPRLLAFREHWWTRLWGLPNAAFLLAVAIGSGLLLRRKIGPPWSAIYALALALTGLTVTVLALLFTDLQPRFTVNLGFCAFLALAMLAAAGIDAAESGKGAAVALPSD